MEHTTTCGSQLLPGERICNATRYSALTYFRRGSTDKPLVVFLPGGGHLARIAYGHPDLRADDFLDHWLAQEGFGLVAISYPSDHPVYDRLYPAMTLADWAKVAAGITKQVIDENGLGPNVLLLGWSMAGYIVRRFNEAAIAEGLEVGAFFSLAATPPLFLNTDIEASFRLSPEGLRETRGPSQWIDLAIAEQTAINGRPVFDHARYESMFRVNHPLNINGGQKRWQDGQIVIDVAAAVEDLGNFDYQFYPITACLVPQSANDIRHAFTDAANWNFLNVQSVLRRWVPPEVQADPKKLATLWRHLSSVSDHLQKLTTSIPGGHLFFTGEIGARATARAIAPLLTQIQRLRAGLDAAARL
ncbi:alpha/beta fold hydrolase [Rhizobium miluonense]|uniref:Uncharacterized protein n=1 Tax=Rhizobium miluonense TaxID=411945 RepID=A0A1C3WD27_9HYPH|nr:alpha/beta hydrolase [Rhizobium miluonense]SCB38052.1 hypothetical protein GA0061102_102750 [Rhizobium miluonense]